MTVLHRRTAIAIVVMAGLGFAGLAAATPVTMDFDQLLNARGEYVDHYYNGGCTTPFAAGAPTCGGPDYGVVWSGALAAPAGPADPNVPSAPNLMTYMGPGATMNVATGFGSGLSFHYFTLGNAVGDLAVYSGLDGTGTLLASATLPATRSRCGLGPAMARCWDLFEMTFDGMARSVVFSGTHGRIGFDDVGFDMASPTVAVPEPAGRGMFGLGLLLAGLMAWSRRRRRRCPA